MSIIVEPIHAITNINTNNHHEFCPFVALGDLVYVQASWWRALGCQQRKKLIERFGQYYGFAIREEIPKRKDEDNDAFWQFFSAYISTFTVENWHDCLDSPHVISLIDSKTMPGLEKLSKLAMIRYRKVSKEQIDEFYNPLLAKSLRKFIEIHKNTGVFMKVSDKSGKYSSKVTPKFSLEQIVEDIVNNRDLTSSLTRHGKYACILLTPWRPEINKSNEFRAIVNHGYLTGISQQQCYKYVGLTAEMSKKAAESILTWFEKNKKKIPYQCCVLDIWVDSQWEAHLIEINPGELWASSGSSLFNWVKDRNKLYQKERTYVRYVDKNKLNLI